MQVTFNLGPSTGLVSRQLTVTQIPGAGDNVPMDPEYDENVGVTTTADVVLPHNRLWQAKLVDHLVDGTQRPPQVTNFNTGSQQFVQKRADHEREGTEFYILNMVEVSSSSSSGSSSTSSASSSSSSASSLSSSTASSASSASSSSSSQT